MDVSEKARKVSKTTNALDVLRLQALLKTLKSFLRRYVKSIEAQIPPVEVMWTFKEWVAGSDVFRFT
ncbi:hypothetical protein TNCV_3072951 [Trichonephila clavipes]|nr:hypothetical protein TNCV_3072951 [Trichonephila clavipes]